MRILIADDEKDITRLLKDALTRNNYTVDVANDGDTAYHMASEGEYDCIILDVLMPGKDGLEVINELRHSAVRTPILLVTALDSTNDKVAGLDIGADDFIAKPFALNELMARVRALCRRSTNYTPGVIQFGDLALNCGTYEISCKDKSLRLTNKEFQLMELLIRNPQTLFSTESLMERFWSWDADVEINVVWTNIGYLRRKIEALGAHAEIRSFRSRGYQLVEK